MSRLPLLIFVFLLNFLAANSIANTANSIIAEVNDTVLTFANVNHKIKSNATKAEKLSVINAEIDLILQLEQIQALGISPKPATVKAALNQIATKNNLTLEQLRAADSFTAIIQNINQQLSLLGLKQMILQKTDIQLSNSELQAISAQTSGKSAQQIKIAQIVISSIDQTDNLSQSEDVLIQQFLTKLSTEIKQGASFSDIAKLHSQDPSYKNGGVSKWLDKQKILAKFTPLSKLKKHELSQPFKARYGWMIAKIIDQRTIDTQHIELKKQKLHAKKDQYYKNWVKSLRKNAYIEVLDHKL